ncbi:MAG TPA: 4Fe-4S dicluster domain-containing protein [Thermoguttaceae bacterium]|nr:4Fe-4S dicluster domain-containing protein [Thermoguttaceae bacterium]
MIEPLYGGKSAIEVLATLLGEEPSEGSDLVRKHFPMVLAERRARSEPQASTGDPQATADRTERDTETHWRQTLHDGLLAQSEWRVLEADDLAPPEQANPESPPSKPETEKLEIVFCPDARLLDGRFANNGWLQEMPDPMTRLTWGNAALVSPATASELGVEDGSLVRLDFRGRAVEIPAYVMPGQADGSVAVELGYGRTAAGHVGGLEGEVEPVGVDVYRLRTSDAMHFATGLTVEPTGRKVRLATVQDHYAIDAVGRRARDQRVGTLIRETTLDHYREHPDFAKHAVHHPPLESLWKEHEYRGYRWGMAIDLSKCIGCGACVVACQAENDVPIVGRQRVLQGREMHWIRVDRYFRGDPGSPRVVMQPVACHHCELAPCEQVCPVAATVHDAEGLNVMVYNRCVGTRYCANNCPYNVRRFNFFNYHKKLTEPASEVTKMAYNPEVTVRSRGVMEKCTYCVQRIKAAAIEARNGNRRVEDGDVKTACQQVCPTGAIAFGDLADPKSQVARAAARDRSYAMLGELNVKPRTVYLARIRNPNPRLGAADRHGVTEEHGAGS